ncbi:MAG TPA: 3-oxoacyl-[acyl-carrier-protein] synthase III C-terminal domain-containing protein [Alphaproteobacteria bacterium]|nr:3-oxoacyl-[acyl-carrier-protein] synthase III C-terminal domain-containing protein [Alphaproteobacteria bacterium]
MSPDPKLLALSTAVPDHMLRQADVREIGRAIFSRNKARFERLVPVYANAGIETRYSCVPLDWYLKPHSWRDRNTLYVENAVALLERATLLCLEKAHLDIGDVDAIVAVSTSGIATPTIDALLIERLNMRRDIRRLPIFGLGCAGGVVGFSRAAEMARASPGMRVLFLVVELCGLTFRRNDHTKSNVIATALFGDGAAAAVISCDGDGPAMTAAGEHTWPGSLEIMGWRVRDDGLGVMFSRDIPALLRSDFRDTVNRFLARHGLSIADIEAFICHPGGAKILTALEEAFELPSDGLVHSRAVLRDYGNMSAATVMFVLESVLANGGLPRRSLMTSLGPGFTAGFMIIENAATHVEKLPARSAA